MVLPKAALSDDHEEKPGFVRAWFDCVFNSNQPGLFIQRQFCPLWQWGLVGVIPGLRLKF